MPFYDLVCDQGHEQYDLYLKVGDRPPCPLCASPTSTLWKSSPNVVGDDIPGGLVIDHLDSTPRRYYSKSEIARAAKAKGLVNLVEHVTPPGTDKAPHTTRWV